MSPQMTELKHWPVHLFLLWTQLGNEISMNQIQYEIQF